MKHLLLAKGLWGVVDGSDVLADGANAQATTDYRKRTQKAFTSIVMAVGTSQLYLITSTESPRDAWDILRNHFERDTLANKLFLKKQYFWNEMKEGTSMEAHLKHMKEITDRLAVIGTPLSEEDQVVTLLGCLPRSYSALVTALEACTDGVSLSFVQQALRHEEQKLFGGTGASNSYSESQPSSALVSMKKRYKPWKTNLTLPSRMSQGQRV